MRERATRSGYKNKNKNRENISQTISFSPIKINQNSHTKKKSKKHKDTPRGKGVATTIYRLTDIITHEHTADVAAIRGKLIRKKSQ